MFPETNPSIDLKADLIDLAVYRTDARTAGGPDPIVVLVAYAQDELAYDAQGRIITPTPEEYAHIKCSPDYAVRNRLVNKFGHVYRPGTPLFLHRRLADVIIDTAIDMRDRYRHFTVVMDGLRTYDSGLLMQNDRPDLVKSGMLAPAGTSAHNRALAVDSKLFELTNPADYERLPATVPLSLLQEADEHGHLDDEQDMRFNSRFYSGPMSIEAGKNRLRRLQAWQRAAIKNRTPIANLLAEFWDDRVPGSPADLWRVLVCRAMCLGLDANPASNAHVAALKTASSNLHANYEKGLLTRQQLAEQAHALCCLSWQQVFSSQHMQQLDSLLGPGGGDPPELADCLFHEWLETIRDQHLTDAGKPAQSLS